jgi:hypothetical protein
MTLFTPDLDAPQWQRLSKRSSTATFKRLLPFVKRKAGEYCRERREFKYRTVKTPYIIGQWQKKNRSSTKIYRITPLGWLQKKRKLVQANEGPSSHASFACIPENTLSHVLARSGTVVSKSSRIARTDRSDVL